MASKRYAILLLLLAACILTGATKYAPPALITEPKWQAHYTFSRPGKTVPNEAPNQKTPPATAIGSPAAVAGPVGKAIRLDGKSGFAVAGFKGGRGFTIAAWVRTTFAGYQYVVAKGNNNGGSLFLRFQLKGRPRAGFLAADNTTTFLDAERAINDGKWRHLATTYDGYELRIYIDGQVAARMPVSSRLPVYERLTYIGGFDVAEDDGGPDAHPFRGDLDEVRLLDAAASPETIATWAKR